MGKHQTFHGASVKTLPLYPEQLPVPLTDGLREELTSSCTRCPLGLGTGTQNTICMAPRQIDGDPTKGTLLIIDDMPDSTDDRSGAPFMSDRGIAIRRMARAWGGHVVVDYAQKCKGTGKKADKIDKEASEKCAPYMRSVFDEANPVRVIAVGHKAARSVLGRHIPTLDARKAYSWVQGKSGQQIPVFTVLDPKAAEENIFVQRWLKEDFDWACGVDLETLWQPLKDEVFHIVESLEDAIAADEFLRTQEWVAYDCETAGKMYSDFFKVVSVSLTPAGLDTAYVWGREALADPAARQVLLDLLADPSVGKTGANLKYDLLAAHAGFGIEVKGGILDVQLTRHLQLPGTRVGLDILSEMLGCGGHKAAFDKLLSGARKSIRAARKNSGNNTQLSLLQQDPILTAAVANPDDEVDAYAYGLIQSPDLERYNARDTVATRRASLSSFGFELILNHAPTKNIWRGVVGKMTDVYTQIEAWGVRADRDAIRKFNTYITEKVRVSGEKFSKLNINLDSPKQKAAYLFDTLKLRDPGDRPGKKPTRSTDQHAMKRMKDKHPIIADMMEHSRISKLASGYGTLDRFIRSDGRIHPSFRVGGTATGRISLADPSLHTLPHGEDGAGNTEGAMIKNCFAVAPGRRLVSLDQSQVEYRVAAAESQDPVMRAAFIAGGDFHHRNAMTIAPWYWKIAPEDVTKVHRTETKKFSFGLLYGMGDRTIASSIGISVDRAVELRVAMMGSWSNLAAWIQDQIDYALRTGTCVSTWEGGAARVRNLYQIGNRGEDRISNGAMITAKNGSFNSPIQGKASDVVQSAVCKIVPWIKKSGIDAKLVLTVHDSIMFDVAEDQEARLVQHVRGVMTDFDLWGVPLVADAESGTSWGNMQKLK